jgi:hypothetical protein
MKLRTMGLLLALILSTLPAYAASPVPLRAGPVTMVFDVDNVFLRYINVGEHEILRGINAPIRPHDWSTVAPRVSNLLVDNGGDHFRVTFDVHCRQPQMDIDFRWKGSITGSRKGVVELTFDGEAHTAFNRNRIGFCMLHGPSAAGQAWMIETTDGKKSEGAFPKFISPHQPARDLRAITHEVAPGIRARVAFEGEVFEMEDQRNWTDASFKTYCTPLDRPYPVPIALGDRVSQKIRISLTGDLPMAAETNIKPVLTLGKSEAPLPRLGLQVSSEVDGLTRKQVHRLKALSLDHLRVDLALSNKLFTRDLRRAVQQAKALDVSLQIGLRLGDTPDFETLVREIEKLNPSVSHWLVTGGVPAHFTMARTQLKPVIGKSRIGVTRVTHFVDLNRARPEDKGIEVVGFAMSPQIHAFDNASIVETLEIQADTVHSARHFVGNLPLIIGPVTLCPQWVNGEDPPGGPPPGDFPTYVDPRQGTKFAAAWTLGSIKYLADARAHSVTFFETVGWNGVMDIDDISKRPQGWPSQAGKRFPVYRLFKQIGAFAGGTVRRIDSSQPLTTEAIALFKDGKQRVLIANFSDETQIVTLRGLGDPRDVQLAPHAIARIDP